MNPGRSLLAHGSNMIHNHYIRVMGTLIPEVDCNKEVSIHGILAKRSERRHLLQRRIPVGLRSLSISTLNRFNAGGRVVGEDDWMKIKLRENTLRKQNLSLK